MHQNKISLKGITPINEIPDLFKNIPHNRIRDSHILRVSENIYPIAKMVELQVNIKIQSNRKINNNKGCSYIIVGFIDLDILYIGCDEKLHKVKYAIPFSSETKYKNKDLTINKAFAVVENLGIKTVNSTDYLIDTTVFLAPLPESIYCNMDYSDNDPTELLLILLLSLFLTKLILLLINRYNNHYYYFRPC